VSSDVVVDSLHMIIFGGIAMTASALHRATGGQELTFTQWRAIYFVGETAQGSRVSEVANRLMGTLSATSRLLRRLEDRGVLTLERDETDRRATRARLTDEGRRLREAVLDWRRQQIVEVTRDVTVAPEVERALVALADRFEARGREAGPRRSAPDV
jgi:DNA-binding MarR family transcriptional regulator